MPQTAGSDTGAWPALPFEEWRPVCDTIHMWTQIVGKIRLALSPMMNEWWQVPLYVSSRGLTTSPIPCGGLIFEIVFDFIDHNLLITLSDGRTASLPLRAISVASFYRELMDTLGGLGIRAHIWPVPVEVPDPIPCTQDETHASYDRDYANRFFQALVQVDITLKAFRSRFTAKTSPVQYFWGTFDMSFAVYSGRFLAPGEGLDPITRIAFAEEQYECGWWPGDHRYGHPAFYAFGYPAPGGLADQPLRPETARWDGSLGLYVLDYEDARISASPRDAALEFLNSTYDAVANAAGFDKERLERKAWDTAGHPMSF